MPRTHLRAILFACLLIPASSAAQSGPEQRPLLIRHVSVVDVTSGVVVHNRDILVVGDRIEGFGESGSLSAPLATVTIDGRGLYAVPGLVDMHVHLESQDLALYLASGVTTIRVLNGSPDVLKIRRAVRQGERTGPTIFTSGPLMAGSRQQYAHSLVETRAEAEAEARSQVKAGYDFLKVYDGLSAGAYEAIVAVGNESGLPVLGHIPAAVGLDGILAAHQTTIEHAEQIVQATVGHDLDLSRIPDIVRRVKAAGISVTPTMAAVEILSRAGTAWYDSLSAQPEMAYADPALRGWWMSLKDSRPFPEESREAWIEFHRTLTRSLFDAGVPLLVGTDASNPLLVPGFSFGREIAALERAGVTPLAILRAATIGALAHLHQGPLMFPERGSRADFLLLDGNPIEDLNNLTRPFAVILGGKLFDRPTLDSMVSRVAEDRKR